MISFHDLKEVSSFQAMAWLEEIAANLRDGDIAEMQATNPLPPDMDFDPFLLLVISYQASEEAVIVCDGERPICVFGVADEGDGEGCVWMLGTDGMEGRLASFTIARSTPAYLDKYHQRWRRLSNYVDARNAVSMRWLLHNDFQIEDLDPYHGCEYRPFYLFSSLREGPSNL